MPYEHDAGRRRAWRSVVRSPSFPVAVLVVDAGAAVALRAAGETRAAYLQLGVGALLPAGTYAPRRRS